MCTAICQLSVADPGCGTISLSHSFDPQLYTLSCPKCQRTAGLPLFLPRKVETFPMVTSFLHPEQALCKLFSHIMEAKSFCVRLLWRGSGWHVSENNNNKRIFFCISYPGFVSPDWTRCALKDCSSRKASKPSAPHRGFSMYVVSSSSCISGCTFRRVDEQ